MVCNVLSEALSWVLNFSIRVKEMLILILQTKKSRPQETKFLVQGHMASK